MRLMLHSNRVQPIHRVQTGVDDATGLSIDSLLRSAHAEWALRLRCSVPACGAIGAAAPEGNGRASSQSRSIRPQSHSVRHPVPTTTACAARVPQAQGSLRVPASSTIALPSPCGLSEFVCPSLSVPHSPRSRERSEPCLKRPLSLCRGSPQSVRGPAIFVPLDHPV